MKKCETEGAVTRDRDRVQQLALLAALGGWARALRRDECGDWAIKGTEGRIYTWGDDATWLLVVHCRSARHWTATKQKLGFCDVTQDGDTEGCLRLTSLPTPEQAIAIREVLGIRKRAEFAPDALEQMRARLPGKRHLSVQDGRSRVESYPGTGEGETPILEPEAR